MPVLVTGAAGFIGYHVAARLLGAGEHVIGIDNLNPYYDVRLKQGRLQELAPHRRFEFHQADLTDLDGMTTLLQHRDIEAIIHLAAQPGVRYSLENPIAYVDANVKGQVAVLEAARRMNRLNTIVYASSSSVYGMNEKQPFSITDRADHPVSLYAATKRAAELVTESYCHLYGLSCTGLRFFTVYGPWGRPDMAYYLFTQAIVKGKPIKVFNEGRMSRDFTYIDDIVPAILAAIIPSFSQPAMHRLYNLGNEHPESLLDFIAILERSLNRRALIELLPMEPGDVLSTYAEITSARHDLGFDPKISISSGLPQFVDWYTKYHAVENTA
jgi:UDP-glucuronate 4-epimerase